MPKKPASFSAFHKSGDGDDAGSWHDLVAAVVALGGSPRVFPPAALFAGVERKLGFVPQQTVWWRSSRVLGGAAAALIVSLGWLAWRASSPHDGGAQVANAASSASGAEDSSDAAGLSSAGGAAVNSEAKATPPRAAGSAGTTPAAGAGVASLAPSVLALTPPTQKTFIAATPETARNGVARGGSGTTTSAGSAVNDEATFAVAQSSGRIKRTDPIELRSDFYVVGMIAAALQDPVSANPYESVAQPLEWTDWRSGYEFGAELPPADTLALSATWTWQDPRNQSLVAGAASDGFGPSIADPISGTPVSDLPGVSASIAAPEPVSSSATRTLVQPPADESKP